MKASCTLRRALTALCVLTVVALIWKATSAEKPPRNPLSQGASTFAKTSTLGGPDRYLTHLSTDKPIYRRGETMYMRGVILHHATRKPLPSDAQISALVEIQGPKGDTVASGYVAAQDSVLGYSWTIPDEQAGGEYTIKVTDPFNGQPPAERKFDIRAFRAPRLKSQIRFLRDGYGPGDLVAAAMEVERAEGGVPAGAAVTVIARVDGDEVYRGGSFVDDQGICETEFQLPATIQRGEGTLAMVIEDGGVVETASKTIPILLQTVDLTMYPEGGELVAGLPNRVYFEAFTPAKKPADLAGSVVDGDGREVARFQSEHEGRGRFEFTPQEGAAYSLKISEPSGINKLFPLPEVEPRGVVLQADHDVYEAGEPVTLRVGCRPVDNNLIVTVSQRERELASLKPDFRGAGANGLAPVSFQLPPEADGVLMATVWDAAGKPLAERLIFRRPAKSVHVKITADSDQYVPGGTARLTIEATDEAGQPTSAVVGLTVTDDSVLEMIEKREQAPSLPVMVFLENNVRELADAHVYLDPNDPMAPLAVDLLLGTQGWRRFAFVDPAPFIEKHGDAARRALALRMESRERLMEVWSRSRPRRGRMALPMLGVPPAAAPVDGLAVDDAPVEAAEVAKGAPPVPPGQDDGAEMAAPAEEPPPVALRPAEPVAAGEALAVEKPAGRAAPRLPMQREEMSADRQELNAALDVARKRRKEGRLFAEAEEEAPEIRNDFVPVRVYAHQVRSGRIPGERIDFTETLFWHAGIKTDAQTGKATVEFGLNDAVTSFRVFADAFSGAGALGSASEQIESVEPYYLEPKLPLEVTAGDRILLPIGVVNATGSITSNAKIAIQAHPSLEVPPALSPQTLVPKARVRRLLPIGVGQYNGEVELTIRGTAGPYSDQVTRTMTVKPQGFPIEAGFGGMLARDGTATHRIEIPSALVEGSLTSRAVVYPTPLANLTEALARLIREPYGCFEQTSSTTYPLVMAQQYFTSHTGVDPELIQRSDKLLGQGYERLVGFECKGHGYEWFGADPGHEALTAYGLLEFTDMAQVRQVDHAMLRRTRGWLLGTRDGQGGFKRERRALHSWVADRDCSNAYILWALLQSGEEEDLSDEVDWVRSASKTSQNTYVIALAANVLALAGDKDGTNQLLDRLAGTQTADGSLEGASTSIVGSGGDALKIETTALAVLGWLSNPRYAANVEQGMKFLAESCKAGRFGSTQSTVLALRAIVAYDQSRARPKAPGALQLIVDGRSVGQPVPFAEDTQGAIELPDVSGLMTPGNHAIQVRMQGGSDMPYSLAVNYNTLKPVTSESCKLHLEVDLRDARIDEGGVTEASVVVVNRTGEPIPTPIAIIGIPGGLEVRHDQLKELVKSEKIAAYEVLGRDVVLYWRSLAAEQRIELPISLVAAVPGRYTGPASRAYLYYTDEFKHWADGLKVEIVPRRES
jgi:hypothetical protein